MKIIYENKELIIYDGTHIASDRYYVDHKIDKEQNYWTNMSYIEDYIYNKKEQYKQLNIFELMEK